MTQFIKLGPSRRDLMKERIGESIGQSLSNFSANYFANKALEDTISNPSFKKASQADKSQSLVKALQPYGEVGQGLLEKTIAIEQQRRQEKGEKSLAKVFGKLQRGEPIDEQEFEGLNPDAQQQVIKGIQSMQLQQENNRTQKKTQASQPIDSEQLNLIQQTRNDPRYEKSSPPKKYQLLTDNGVSKENAKAEADLFSEQEKTGRARSQELRKETLPIRTKLAEKAQAAERGIQNKEQLIELIEKGDLNDPTFATLAEALPLNLGKRLLSPDTVEYKAGLVEEFGDLRNIFQGQTKIKEIDLLENKIADIYLTDEQKKAVLRSRTNALRADIIRAQAAAEIEDSEDLGVLQFNEAVEKKAKPKLEALFNQILGEQKSIIQNAEARKKIPLDLNDPEDKNIIEQIVHEAKGDAKKAMEIAKKKGYSW
jgi:hypothetical protein